jgi:hypothetical protein
MKVPTSGESNNDTKINIEKETFKASSLLS